MGSGGSWFNIKTVFGIVALVGFVWLLLVGTTFALESSSGSGETTKQTKSLKNYKVMIGGGGEKVDDKYYYSSSSSSSSSSPPSSSDHMINSMSKRRVPNGPDPIHNRRAGNSGRPPGQA